MTHDTIDDWTLQVEQELTRLLSSFQLSASASSSPASSQSPTHTTHNPLQFLIPIEGPRLPTVKELVSSDIQKHFDEVRSFQDIAMSRKHQLIQGGSLSFSFNEKFGVYGLQQVAVDRPSSSHIAPPDNTPLPTRKKRGRPRKTTSGVLTPQDSGHHEPHLKEMFDGSQTENSKKLVLLMGQRLPNMNALLEPCRLPNPIEQRLRELVRGSGGDRQEGNADARACSVSGLESGHSVSGMVDAKDTMVGTGVMSVELHAPTTHFYSSCKFGSLKKFWGTSKALAFDVRADRPLSHWVNILTGCSPPSDPSEDLSIHMNHPSGTNHLSPPSSRTSNMSREFFCDPLEGGMPVDKNYDGPRFQGNGMLIFGDVVVSNSVHDRLSEVPNTSLDVSVSVDNHPLDSQQPFSDYAAPLKGRLSSYCLTFKDLKNTNGGSIASSFVFSVGEILFLHAGSEVDKLFVTNVTCVRNSRFDSQRRSLVGDAGRTQGNTRGRVHENAPGRLNAVGWEESEFGVFEPRLRHHIDSLTMKPSDTDSLHAYHRQTDDDDDDPNQSSLTVPSVTLTYQRNPRKITKCFICESRPACLSIIEDNELPCSPFFACHLCYIHFRTDQHTGFRDPNPNCWVSEWKEF